MNKQHRNNQRFNDVIFLLKLMKEFCEHLLCKKSELLLCICVLFFV